MLFGCPLLIISHLYTPLHILRYPYTSLDIFATYTTLALHRPPYPYSDHFTPTKPPYPYLDFVSPT